MGLNNTEMLLLLNVKIFMDGICNLSNIPLRREADSRSEIVSMLLFGEIYRVEEVVDGWTKIATYNDQYEGWIGSRQFMELTKQPQSFAVVTDYPFAILQDEHGVIMAPCGSQLPDYNGMECSVNDITYKVVNQQKKFEVTDLPYIAKRYQNAPYLWGGRSPFGIDCSGFTKAVYKCLNIELRRDAWQQAEMGTTVSFLEEVKTGDLAFFDNEEGRITHVGIMLDFHTIIHASGRVRIDMIDNYGIMNSEERTYSHKLRIIKRIL
jgi:cell wall-associated NlpC family hydrolase